MFEDIKNNISYYMQQAAVWITGKGTSLAVAMAATAAFAGSGGGLGGFALIPMISLPFAGAIASVNTQIGHGKNENRLLNAYRKEIGAFLDIDPSRVTIEHVYMIANGNEKLGIPPNSVLKEALEKNDSVRTNDIFSHIGAAVISVGVVMGMITGADGGLLGQAVEYAGYSMEGATAKVAVGILAGATSFVIDNSLGFLSRQFTGLNKRVANDRIRDITRDINDGKDITKERVFDLFAYANHDIGEAIKKEFGAEYAVLPGPIRENILQRYDERFHISDITQLINDRRLDATELAFAAHGMTSGVAARPPDNPPVRSPEPEMSAEKGKGKESPESDITLTPVAAAAGSSIVMAHDAGVGYYDKEMAVVSALPHSVNPEETRTSFAERFARRHSPTSYAKMVSERVTHHINDDLRKEDSKALKSAFLEEAASDAPDALAAATSMVGL